MLKDSVKITLYLRVHGVLPLIFDFVRIACSLPLVLLLVHVFTPPHRPCSLELFRGDLESFVDSGAGITAVAVIGPELVLQLFAQAQSRKFLPASLSYGHAAQKRAVQQGKYGCYLVCCVHALLWGSQQ
jgi:hypothetical protein